MDIVEKVAFAIAKARRDAEGQVRPSQLYEHLARAAIAAMREPTQGMLVEAQRAWTPGVNYLDAHAIRYQAMIDVALTSSEPQAPSSE
jgi:hypothetical protein